MKNLTFGEGFKYPFKKPMRLFNILWILVPILGIFAISGYGIRIAKEIMIGKTKQLPKMHFGDDLKYGFIMFLKMLVFAIPYFLLSFIPFFGIVALFLGLPVLYMNFFKKETIGSLFEFDILSKVFKNYGQYWLMIVKTMGLNIIFLILVLVLVGLPAMAFANIVFYADFYGKYISEK